VVKEKVLVDSIGYQPNTRQFAHHLKSQLLKQFYAWENLKEQGGLEKHTRRVTDAISVISHLIPNITVSSTGIELELDPRGAVCELATKVRENTMQTNQDEIRSLEFALKTADDRFSPRIKEIFDKTVKKIREKYYLQLEEIDTEKDVELLAEYVAERILAHAVKNPPVADQQPEDFLAKALEFLPQKKLERHLKIRAARGKLWDAALLFQSTGLVDDDDHYYIRTQPEYWKKNLKYGYARGKPSQTESSQFQHVGKSKAGADQQLKDLLSPFQRIK